MFCLKKTTNSIHSIPTGDRNRKNINADELAENPDVNLDKLYDFLVRYVCRVHSDKFIRKALRMYPKASFVDVLMQSEIAYVIAIIR